MLTEVPPLTYTTKTHTNIHRLNEMDPIKTLLYIILSNYTWIANEIRRNLKKRSATRDLYHHLSL